MAGNATQNLVPIDELRVESGLVVISTPEHGQVTVAEIDPRQTSAAPALLVALASAGLSEGHRLRLLIRPTITGGAQTLACLTVTDAPAQARTHLKQLAARDLTLRLLNAEDTVRVFYETFNLKASEPLDSPVDEQDRHSDGGTLRSLVAPWRVGAQEEESVEVNDLRLRALQIWAWPEEPAAGWAQRLAAELSIATCVDLAAVPLELWLKRARGQLDVDVASLDSRNQTDELRARRERRVTKTRQVIEAVENGHTQLFFSQVVFLVPAETEPETLAIARQLEKDLMVRPLLYRHRLGYLMGTPAPGYPYERPAQPAAETVRLRTITSAQVASLTPA